MAMQYREYGRLLLRGGEGSSELLPPEGQQPEGDTVLGVALPFFFVIRKLATCSSPSTIRDTTTRVTCRYFAGIQGCSRSPESPNTSISQLRCELRT